MPDDVFEARLSRCRLLSPAESPREENNGIFQGHLDLSLICKIMDNGLFMSFLQRCEGDSLGILGGWVR